MILSKETALYEPNAIRDGLERAGNTADSYITTQGSDGIFVSPATNENPTLVNPGDSILINGEGMNVYKNGVSVAEYGTTSRVGAESSGHTILDLDGMTVSNGDMEILNISGIEHNDGVVPDLTWREYALQFKPDLENIGGNYATVGLEGTANIVMSESALEPGGTRRSDIVLDANAIELVTDYGGIYLGDFENRGTVRDTITVGYRYLSLEAESTLWYLDVAPPNSSAGSTIGTAVWHESGNGNYGLYKSASSSRRYKEDIEPIKNEELDPHKLYDIPVIQFKYKDDYFPKEDVYNEHRYDLPGFIAEDIYEHYPRACVMLSGKPENWDARYMIPPMLKLIQELHEEVEILKTKVSQLEDK